MVEGRDVAELLTGIASLKWPSRRTPASMVVTSLTCRESGVRARGPDVAVMPMWERAELPRVGRPARRS